LKGICFALAWVIQQHLMTLLFAGGSDVCRRQRLAFHGNVGKNCQQCERDIHGDRFVNDIKVHKNLRGI